MGTGERVGEPLQGHTGEASSVAISSDGEYIVTGSYDKTLQIMKRETGGCVEKPVARTH